MLSWRNKKKKYLSGSGAIFMCYELLIWINFTDTPAKQNFVTSQSSTVELGSVTYVQAKPGALVRQSSLKTRVVAA